MSKSSPKHRAAKHRAEKAPRRSPQQAKQGAPREGSLRRTVVVSSVAVAATGVVVTGGVSVLTHGPAVADTRAVDRSATAPVLSPVVSGLAAKTVSDAEAARGATTSRSFDRRAAADPRKAASLASATSTTAPSITRTESLSQADPRDIGRALLSKFGWSSDQFGCLDSLWTRESGWRVDAANPSGAYGIPQSLPGSKMASAGSDWATNPVTQITWGLGYIQDRYGSPCGAWGHSESYGWY